MRRLHATGLNPVYLSSPTGREKRGDADWLPRTSLAR